MSPTAPALLWLTAAIIAIVSAPVAWLLLPILGVNAAHATGATGGLLLGALVFSVLFAREA